MQDIAKTANMARGTIYLYFKNKDELIEHCFNKYFLEQSQKVISCLSIEKTVIENIEKLIDKSLEVAIQDQDLGMLFLEYTVYNAFEYKDSSLVEKQIEGYTKSLKDFLSKCKGFKLKPEYDFDTLVSTIDYALDGIIFNLFTLTKTNENKKMQVIEHLKLLVRQCFDN